MLTRAKLKESRMRQNQSNWGIPVDSKGIYGVGSAQTALSKKLRISSMEYERFNIMHYNWNISCETVTDEEIPFYRITAELSSPVFCFGDRHLLNISLESDGIVLSQKEFELKMSKDKQLFELPVDPKTLAFLSKVHVFGRIEVKDITYLSTDFIPNNEHTDFTNELKPHDVVLIVGDTKFYVLKTILAMQSRYFDRLFYGDFKERTQTEIEIKEVDSDDFALMLALILPGRSSKLTKENVKNMLMMGDRFDIPCLMVQCSDLLCSINQSHRCCCNPDDWELMDYIELADEYNLATVMVSYLKLLGPLPLTTESYYYEKYRERFSRLSKNTLISLFGQKIPDFKPIVGRKRKSRASSVWFS